MISCRQIFNEGFVAIRLSNDLRPVYGARITFSVDGKEFKSCSIYKGLDATALLDCTFWEWNDGVNFGNVKFDEKPHDVYWNLYLNGMNNYEGNVTIRAEILSDGEVKTEERNVDLKKSKPIYFNDWQKFIPDGSNWLTVKKDTSVWNPNDNTFKPVNGGSLSIPEKKYAEPVKIKPGLKGNYRVYLGVPQGALGCMLKVSNEDKSYPFVAEMFHAEFMHKSNKELLWKTVRLEKDSEIEISVIPYTVNYPGITPFGVIAYLKFVPVFPVARKQKTKWQDKKLALYFEPYSWAFYYNLNSPEEVKSALSIYREMGADELHNQVIRFGSATLHYSKTASIMRGMMIGDMEDFSEGPKEMVKNIDILTEAIKACKELGMTHYANAGLTNCYPGTDMEDKIVKEHPDWRIDNILRFDLQETRDYASSVIGEFMEWGTEGVSIDCMRYPYHHTEENLLKLFYQFFDVIKKKRGNVNVPFSARIPWGDVTYYNVFGDLAKEGLVTCVIPSALMSLEPECTLKPYLKWKDYGCRIYGRIDGWKSVIYKNDFIAIRPDEIKAEIIRYFSEGADGIFVYQADHYLADCFNRTTFDWKNW